MTVKEKEKAEQIDRYMKTLGISYEEACQLWEDDNSDEVLPEVAEMERKCKEDCKRRYEQGTKERKKVVKERKVDTEKGFILDLIKTALEGISVEGLTVQTETKIGFEYNGNSYTLMLTKHRKK